MVRANGRGISLITESRLERMPRGSGYAWKLPANLSMPHGLGLFADMVDTGSRVSPDHYLLCPASDMLKNEYISLLEKLALKLERSQKL